MSHRYSLIIHHSITEVSESDWSALEDPQSPFCDWQFLRGLEASKSVGEATGWIPIYLTCWEEKILTGALFLYLKTNSYGEYIFDWSWADAARRAGIPYYPKLVSAVPFTPASCKKLLVSRDVTNPEKSREVKDLLVSTVRSLSKKLNAHSSHFLFISGEENALLEENGYLLRQSFQYHWKNKGYKNFEDFLGDLKSRKAKQIRKEREKIKAVEIESLTGSTLSAIHAAEFYQFYLSTIDGKNAIPYLSQDFFMRIFQTMNENILLLRAHKDGECIAAALYFFKGSHLYGRYWGSKNGMEFLHFEMCYYQGIDFAIKNNFQVFEAGAQGEHKIARGFLPTLTYSAHELEHPGLRAAIKEFVKQEQASIEETFKALEESNPYKSLTH
ncbi:MAG TPA: GNAT family N-acetyltransferase [Bacteriovoracaceae bacterium]|nr:GNAT family N-acetyltransferase [Bacteriovoracaceae bacterium]